METVSTHYGTIPVAGCLEWHPNGEVLSCTPAGPSPLNTRYGILTPQFTTDDIRRRTVQSVQFHENGQLRALPLERPTLIDTPAGTILAELVTFHPCGALRRVFPLNGKLTGYWTQDDEGRLAKPISFSTPIGPITARLIGLYFNPEGRLKSITLWPGDTLDVPTPTGLLSARVGISFGDDGMINSLEPAKPQTVQTPVGAVQAYDLDAIGICGDYNSLGFSDDGSISRVVTSQTSLRVTHPDGTLATYSPTVRESLCGDSDQEPVPLMLEFTPDLVTVRQAPTAVPTLLPTKGRTFRTEPYLRLFAHPFGKMTCSG